MGYRHGQEITSALGIPSSIPARDKCWAQTEIQSTRVTTSLVGDGQLCPPANSNVDQRFEAGLDAPQQPPLQHSSTPTFEPTRNLILSDERKHHTVDVCQS